MRKITGLVTLVFVLSGTLCVWADKQDRKPWAGVSATASANPAYETGEILVKFYPSFASVDAGKFKAQVQAASVNNRQQAMAAFHAHFQTRARRSLLGWETVVLPAGMSVDQAMQTFSQNALVQEVQPNYRVYGNASSTTYTPQPAPADTYYQNGHTQWWFYRTQADVAYNTTSIAYGNASDIVIAVVDSGVYTAHPEFSGRLVGGYSAVTYTVSYEDDTAFLGGHGTHVTGTIISNLNDYNLAGTAFRSRVKVMPVKVLGSNNGGNISDVAAGIAWAADNNAQIINMSFGIYSMTLPPVALMQNACEYASNSKNCLMISAAGNDAQDIMSNPYYPASFSNVYAVAATNWLDHDTNYSNYGAGGVIDFSAPGGQMYDIPPTPPTPMIYVGDYGVTSTAMGGGYSSMEGTSFAAPQVSALAALLKLQDPSRSNNEIINIIKSTCDNPQGINAGFIGSGRINVYKALLVYRTITPTYTYTPTPTVSPTPTISASITISPTITVSPTVSVSPTVTPTFHGIVDLNRDNLIVFPNPAKQGATLAFIAPTAGSAEFTIYNSAYQLVAHFSRDVSFGGPQLLPWSVADLAPGVYLCKLGFLGSDNKRKNYPISKLVVLK